MIEMSEDFLKTLSEKLGMTVEQIYNVYIVGIKKSAVLSMCSIGIVLLGILFISMFSIGVIANANENSDDYWDDDKNTKTSIDKFNGEDYIALFVLIFCSSAVWTFIISIVFDNIKEYLLPEYYAIKVLLYDLS